jgi:HD-GYP domain-containing protein (c-di-GMP phosphodiesterase class II)
MYARDLLFPIAFLRPALDIPYYHHERWDGSGYPHGLKGEEIPLAARIFAVVDVWDALLSDRPYRVAQTQETTHQYLKENSGKLFDPEVVAQFLEIVEEDKINNP